MLLAGGTSFFRAVFFGIDAFSDESQLSKGTTIGGSHRIGFVGMARRKSRWDDGEEPKNGEGEAQKLKYTHRSTHRFCEDLPERKKGII